MSETFITSRVYEEIFLGNNYFPPAEKRGFSSEKRGFSSHRDYRVFELDVDKKLGDDSPKIKGGRGNALERM